MATSQYAFGRKYRLLTGQSGVHGGALEITDLQIAFSIRRSRTSDADKASIVITNLSDSNIDKFTVRNSVVSLEVGWQGTPLLPLFSGVIESSKTQRNGTDIETTLSLSDAGHILRERTTTRTFPSGITIDEIFRTITNLDMGLAAETSNGDLPSGSGIYTTYKYGRSLGGYSKRVLEDLAKANNLQFYVADGVAYLIPVGAVKPNAHFPLYTPENGLIGSPFKGIPKAKSGKSNASPEKSSGVTFEVILDPTLYPGNSVGVKSSLLDGIYIIDSVTHTGSFTGDDWKTSVETTTQDGFEPDEDESETDSDGQVVE